MKENKTHKVGIYCRLSKDDGTDSESASISTQKSILENYVKEHGWRLVKSYVEACDILEPTQEIHQYQWFQRVGSTFHITTRGCFRLP